MKLLRIKEWITYQVYTKRMLFLAYLNIVRQYIIKKTNNEEFSERLAFEKDRIKLNYKLEKAVREIKERFRDERKK